MKEAPEQSVQFVKLLDLAERQNRIINQWRRAEAQGPTDGELWKAELAKITAEFHGLLLKGVTPGQFEEFNKALAFKLKGSLEEG